MSLSGTRKILIGSQKGGVGKTSIVTGIGSALAAAGARVLVVDADQQGNLTQEDLGVESDSGRNLAMVLQYGVELEPVQARENLDLVRGGVLLGQVQAALVGRPEGAPEAARNLLAALATLNTDTETGEGDRYDFILFDSGPGDTVILDALLSCADWLLIPTKDDSASFAGIKKIAGRFVSAQNAGSGIDLLGVVLFDVNHRATARNAATLTELAGLFSPSDDDKSARAVFETVIRSAPAAAKDLRQRHLAPQELVPVSSEVRAQTFRALRNKAALPTRVWSRDSGVPLATDYQELTREVIKRISDAENAAYGSAADQTGEVNNHVVADDMTAGETR
nr:ParA family protein [Rhodococcus sp. (in: high G+C Gram-positive bacteria)]